MKITDVKTFIMESPGREYVFVKISTDEGLYGWGESTLEMKQGTVVAAVKDLQDFVIGQDPTRIDFLWQRMYRHGFWRGGVAILSALSGIEQALWDITGKAFGQPVYKLLGGAVRDYIPCYTHCGDPERAVQLMEEEGWRAFKSGPERARRGTHQAVDERELVRETASAYDALRQACGDEVQLMCDVHGRLRPSAAIRLGQALQPYDLLFLEEAVPPDNILSLKRVREAGLTMDLATGERAFTKWGYREMLEGQYVDIIQPDLCHDGGIKETLKIGALAETYHVMVAPHNPNGPVGTRRLRARRRGDAQLPDPGVRQLAHPRRLPGGGRGRPLQGPRRAHRAAHPARPGHRARRGVPRRPPLHRGQAVARALLRRRGRRRRLASATAPPAPSARPPERHHGRPAP